MKFYYSPRLGKITEEVYITLDRCYRGVYGTTRCLDELRRLGYTETEALILLGEFERHEIIFMPCVWVDYHRLYGMSNPHPPPDFYRQFDVRMKVTVRYNPEKREIEKIPDDFIKDVLDELFEKYSPDYYYLCDWEHPEISYEIQDGDRITEFNDVGTFSVFDVDRAKIVVMVDFEWIEYYETLE